MFYVPYLVSKTNKYVLCGFIADQLAQDIPVQQTQEEEEKNMKRKLWTVILCSLLLSLSVFLLFLDNLLQFLLHSLQFFRFILILLYLC